MGKSGIKLGWFDEGFSGLQISQIRDRCAIRIWGFFRVVFRAGWDRLIRVFTGLGLGLNWIQFWRKVWNLVGKLGAHMGLVQGTA